MVMPNLGRSVQLDSLVADWQTEQTKNDQAIRIWASQHLNIEMGLGMKTDGWPGAEFWAAAVDETLTLDTLIARSEAIVIGVDGGGLDDLFGLVGSGPREGNQELAVAGRTPGAIAACSQRRLVDRVAARGLRGGGRADHRRRQAR